MPHPPTGPVRRARMLLPLLAVCAVAACSAPEKVASGVKKTAAAVGKTSKRALRSVAPQQACILRLREKRVVFSRVPDLEGPRGCGYRDAVQVTAVGGAELSKPAILRCSIAEKIADWMDKSVQPAAESIYDSSVAKIVVFQSYSCRVARGRRARSMKRFRLSQHARGNALDIAGFVLANGRAISVQSHWRWRPKKTAKKSGRAPVAAGGRDSAKSEAKSEAKNAGPKNDPRAFLLRISRDACVSFSKVLTPEYDWFHRHHIHLDMAPEKLCGLKEELKKLFPKGKRRPPVAETR
jgi:hypothetical protein